jgi:GNAT acetyltransferase-like protein
VSAIEAEPIRTERLELLPLRVAHAEEMAPVLGDPALYTYIGGIPAILQELRSRYQRLCAGSPDPAASWLNWVVRLRDQDRLTGTVQTTISPTSHGLVAEIAGAVGTAWQGRGHRHRSRRSTRRLARTAAAAQRHRPHPPRSPGLCRSHHRCRARAPTHGTTASVNGAEGSGDKFTDPGREQLSNSVDQGRLTWLVATYRGR